ncbi:MAG TPA: hypothetical protein PKD53_27560 [Chloroflexaceae bacterium]|nr:hypothetical protein [Chloroflexaceae bacterium]
MKRRILPSAVVGIVGVLVAGAVAVSLWQAPRGVAQEPQPLLEYPAFPPTPTIGAPPAVAQLAGVPLAQTGFDAAAALAAWQFVDLDPVLPDNPSNWAVTAEGRLAQQAAGRARNPSIQQTAALIGEAGWSDYTVQTSFYDLTNGTVGLLARYSGETPTTASYYRYRALKNSYEATPKQVLEKVENGVATTLTEIIAPGFEERQWHVLALRVQGGSLTVTLNGQVVAEAEDPRPLPAGRAGLYTRAIGGILFDDVIVTAP